MKLRNSILIPGLLYIFIVISLLIYVIFRYQENDILTIVFAAVIIILVLAGSGFFIFGIYYPLLSLKRKLHSMAEAEVIPKKNTTALYEFKEIDSELETYFNRLAEVVQIANNLAEGKIDEDFKSLGNYDDLGNAILKLKESIIQSNKEALRRRKMDEQLNWQSKGLAKFSELLRDFDSKNEKLASNFIHELVLYMEIEVAGIFLKEIGENGQPQFKLSGAYAFDREKQAKISFLPGEGLVGRCVLEKASIIITDVPKDYIRIRSGLGEDYPSTIILVPVLFSEEVLGVIELATFSEVPNYKIEFLESLGKSIGLTLSKTISTG